MKTYSEATPLELLMDGKVDVDILNSLYKNMRYSVAPERLIILDAKYASNLPGLAYDYYGDTKYWFAILSFNGLQDPINETRAGVRLMLPAKTDIDALLASVGSTKSRTMVI